MVLFFGTQTRIRCGNRLGQRFDRGRSARISAAGLVLVLGTAAVYGGLFLFLHASRWGIRMRAAGQNPLLAAQRGIRLHGVYALAWGLATFTGGMAGMLITCDAGIESTLVTIGLKAFPAALVGGLDSLLGALIGSVIVAGAEVLLINFVDPCFRTWCLLRAAGDAGDRPWGLFGARESSTRR
jgi:branched-chain amino acid transport system permease protein